VRARHQRTVFREYQGCAVGHVDVHVYIAVAEPRGGEQRAIIVVAKSARACPCGADHHRPDYISVRI